MLAHGLHILPRASSRALPRPLFFLSFKLYIQELERAFRCRAHSAAASAFLAWRPARIFPRQLGGSTPPPK